LVSTITVMPRSGYLTIPLVKPRAFDATPSNNRSHDDHRNASQHERRSPYQIEVDPCAPHQV
jgi:hypothetical protein